ncbi:putative transcription factor kapC [Aspergillus unguis]
MQPALAPAPHPSMQTSAQDHADQVLHDSLLAASAHQHLQQHPQQQRPQPPPAQPHHLQPNTASPRDQNNIDPAIAGNAMLPPPSQAPPQPEPADDDEAAKTYGKRPLSTSKRAAQNRAAQRAFRQRKESYIRKLEEQVKEYEVMSQEFKALQSENYQLREYVINLQSRLLDSHGEVPELPGNIDLSQPRAEIPVPQPVTRPTQGAAPAPQQGSPQSQVSIANEDMNSLNRIAEAGLGMRKHPNEEAFMHNNYQARRGRGDEGAEPSETKTENPTHGLPMVS